MNVRRLRLDGLLDNRVDETDCGSVCRKVLQPGQVACRKIRILVIGRSNPGRFNVREELGKSGQQLGRRRDEGRDR